MPKPQTFNDGVANIYSVGNIACPGGMPKDGLKLKVAYLRYKERTVGMSRYWWRCRHRRGSTSCCGCHNSGMCRCMM